MNILYAFILGIIEGLAEFLPVSSTAHMLIAQRVLNIPSDSDNGVFAFLVIVQIGPLIALLIFFWKDYWALIRAFFARPFSTPENRMAWYIIIATIPALLAGLFLKDLIQTLFQNPLLEAAIRLLTAAVLLFLGGTAWTKDPPARLDHLARQPHNRFIPGAGRFSRFIPFWRDHSRWHVS